mgnify:CR=1 FL=1
MECRYDSLERVCLVLTVIVSTADPARVHGPMSEYDARVDSGRLRDDEHQRGMKLDI